jgi:RHS repeat-associated protein
VSHVDGLGSVRALTDASGTLMQTYQTDAYGVPTQTQGTSTQPFGFTGEQRDAETGFVHLPARMYDPHTARFPSVLSDPVFDAVARTFVKPSAND